MALYHDLTVFSNEIPSLYPKVLEPIMSHLDDDKKKLIHGNKHKFYNLFDVVQISIK